MAEIDGLVIAAVDREYDLELFQVGFHRRPHIGVLQLAGKSPPFGTNRAVDLPQGSRRRGFLFEAGEPVLPAGA